MSYRGGKPAFFDAWVNPHAAEPQHEDFPYGEIDGEQPQPGESDLATVAGAVTDLMLDVIGPVNSAPLTVYGRWAGSFDQVLRADLAIARRYGLETAAEQRVFFAMAAVVFSVPLTSYSPDTAAYPGQLKSFLVAVVWVSRPAALGGVALRKLADAMGIHMVSLSKYAAEVSRCFGIRSVGQSKGWNFRADKRSPTREALSRILSRG